MTRKEEFETETQRRPSFSHTSTSINDANEDNHNETNYNDDANIRLISRKSRRMNVIRKGLPMLNPTTWFHSILDYSWAWFFVILAFGFVFVNTIFGLLYFLDPNGVIGVFIIPTSPLFYFFPYLFIR